MLMAVSSNQIKSKQFIRHKHIYKYLTKYRRWMKKKQKENKKQELGNCSIVWMPYNSEAGYGFPQSWTTWSTLYNIHGIESYC